MVEGDQSPQWGEFIINRDLTERKVWKSFQEEVEPELIVLKDTCRVMSPRD